MELMLDRGLEIVRRDRRGVAEHLALGGAGLGSRSREVADRSGAGIGTAGGHHGRASLDGHGLAHDGALLGHTDETVGGGLCGLVRERSQGRRGGVAEKRTGSGSEFHCGRNCWVG